MTLTHRTPHRIEFSEIATFFAFHEIEAASATTADGTQRKRLIKRGGFYIVSRRYLAEIGLGGGWTSMKPSGSTTSCPSSVGCPQATRCRPREPTPGFGGQ